jgi:subfamily B ATP-binding cassette protein MsbA
VSRRKGGAKAALRLLRYFRPYLGRLVLAAALTAVAGACEGGQVYLLQPLLDRVLLKSADSEDDEGDVAVLDALRANVPNAQAALDAQTFPDAPTGPLSRALKSMGGRLASAYVDHEVAGILERSRRVLLNAERGLNAEEEGWLTTFKSWTSKADPEVHREAARAELAKAAQKQLAAEQLLVLVPSALLTEDPRAQFLAAHFSFEARREARAANFGAAWHDLLPILGLAFVAGVLLAFARYFHTLIARVVVVLIGRDLQVDLVKHVLSLSTAQLGTRSRGDLLSRLTTDLQFAVGGVIAPVSTKLLSYSIRLVIYFGFALWVAPRLCVILIALGLMVAIPVRYAGKRIRRGARSRTSALALVTETIYQMFSGIRIVKVFQREGFEKARLRERTGKAYRADLRIARARLGSSSLLVFLNNASLPLVLVIGGYMIVHRMGGLETGSFVVFAALIMLMYRPAKSMVSAYNEIQAGMPSAKRLTDLFDEAPAIVDVPDAVEFTELRSEIRVENLRFSYGEREVLRNISFTAPVGTTTAIVGHTGSGKSTLIDLLARYMDPTGGRIVVDGVPLETLRLSSYLEKLAVVSQGTFLFNDTIRANIRYGRLDATDAEIEEAAKAARVHEEILALDGGYDYLAGEMGGRLSGGQVQRVTIARAMVKRPKILLLDEAMSALDTKTERLVQEAIEELEKDCTLFVIAHRLSTVRDAEQILVLHDGELVERGTHTELAAKGGHYAALLAHMQDDSRE